MNNPFLIGSRVYLRPLERDDAVTLAPWFNSPEVRPYIRRYLPMSVRSEERFLDKPKGEHDVILGIVARENHVLVGSAGLHPIDWKNRQTGFGILIGDPEQRHRGYGGETTTLMVGHAFESLNLNRVWLHVYEDNPAAVRVYERAGFRREGVLRQDNFRRGRYWDTIVMAILREEWLRKAPEATTPS